MRRPSFYAKDWQGSKWVRFDPGGSWLLPRQPACYVIYLDGKLSYIGQTTDLRKRIQMHGIDLCRYSEGYTTAWGDFDRVLIKARFGDRFGDWAMREIRMIARLRPPLNCVGSTKKRLQSR